MMISVIGGGSGAHALAVQAKIKGFKVHMLARSPSLIEQFKMNENSITSTGEIDARINVNSISNKVDHRVADSKLILIAVTANAHKEVAKLLAEHVHSEQIVVLCPGRTGGVLEFRNTLIDCGLPFDACPLIMEMQSLFCACRLTQVGRIDVLSVKKSNRVSGIPFEKAATALEFLSKIFSGFELVESTLETGLENIGALLHPAPVLLNTGWIETRTAFFSHYYQAISPSVASYIEAMDEERFAIAQRLNTKFRTVKRWHEDVYGLKGRSLFETLIKNSAYASIDSPVSLAHRYVYEDVLTGLVPISELGRVLDIRTPRMDTIIALSEQLLNRSFRQEGRNAERLGIIGLTSKDIEDRFKGL